MRSKEKKLNDLKETKKTIVRQKNIPFILKDKKIFEFFSFSKLEEVKEKETYKKAREILGN